MARPEDIARGREAYAGRRWAEAHARLSAADRAAPLGSDALEQLASAAYLVGRDAEALTHWARLHHLEIDQGRMAGAARAGFWLGFVLALSGDGARANGWLARTQRLLEEHAPDCVEHGYLHALRGLLAMGDGDRTGAGASFELALAGAQRFADPDLLALGLLGRGQALLLGGRLGEGMPLLDEAMAGMSAGALSPILGGILYCAVLRACEKVFDLRRAREWTRELDAWCAAQPDLVPFRGHCLVHRAELLQLEGDWAAGLGEAERACRHLAGRGEPIAGRAFYQCGELRRLRGEAEEAEEMYRRASELGWEPQPGLALLRLAQGDVRAARAGIRGAISLGARPDPARARLLGAYVEIHLAAGDAAEARAAADELEALAASVGAPQLAALAATAAGAVKLAEGDASGALARLRDAWGQWERLGAPYESARVRARLGRACRALGDHDAARMHADAAGATFARLGAAPDPADPAEKLHGLTERERQVLALVATGESNRSIAARLEISEHTVARHLSNIFDKLGVTSRTAAGAFAHAHHLV